LLKFSNYFNQVQPGEIFYLIKILLKKAASRAFWKLANLMQFGKTAQFGVNVRHNTQCLINSSLEEAINLNKELLFEIHRK
jgi:hypothetical protein